MPAQALPTELTALIHHVELCKAGWREKLAEQLVLAAIMLNDGRASISQIVQAVEHDFAAPFDQASIGNAVDSLAKQQAIFEATGQYKLAEHFRASVARKIEEAASQEVQAKDIFLSIAEKNGFESKADTMWNSFRDQLLGPMVEELGAATYEVISGFGRDYTGSIAYRLYLDRFPEKERTAASNVIKEFLDPNSDAVRGFVLSQLQSSFLLFAGGLDPATVSFIGERMKQHVTFQLFLDSNTLFSVLELHDNPDNEAAKELVKVATGLSGKINATINALPITIEEMRRVLISYEATLNDITFTGALGRYASGTNQFQSGVITKYLNVRKAIGYSITPEQYFEPYIRHTSQVLAEHGIKLYNENLDALRTDQAVVDDVNSRLEWEQQHRERPKSYDTVLHDMVLWHFTSHMRRPTDDTPVSVRYWVVTLDHTLLGFDAHKSRLNRRTVPVCIHPAVLLQMFQLWMPRTSQYESSLFKSLRGLLPSDFDAEAERVTLTILGVLSRFEKSSDLTETLITATVTDSALRQKMANEPAIEKQIQFVRESLIEHANEEIKKREAAENAKANTELLLASAHEENAALMATVQRLRSEMELAENKSSTGQQEMEKKLSEVERNAESEKAHRERSERITFAVVAVFLLLLCVTVVCYAGAYIDKKLPGAPSWFPIIYFLTGALISWGIADTIACRIPSVSSLNVHQLSHKGRLWVYGVLFILITGLIVSYVYDALKDMTRRPPNETRIILPHNENRARVKSP